MNSLTQAWGLPLLTKELLEQSSRKRTYVIRAVYALLFYGFALMIFWGSIYNNVHTPFELLGRGRELFMILIILQSAGIVLFTPALTCGTITSEKERNTIGLLFLTKLGPFSILLEKYLGRVLVMGTYLLISLPLFGFCYTLGGVEQKQVWFGFYALMITVCQLAALGLCCSCYFRTTVSAFIATYLIGIAMFFGPMFLYEILPYALRPHMLSPMWEFIEGGVWVAGNIGRLGIALCEISFGWDLSKFTTWQPVWEQLDYRNQTQNGFAFFAIVLIMVGTDPDVANWQLLALGIPSLGLTFFFLALSRIFLVRRAFASPKRYLLFFFQLLDKMFHRANQNRFTKGIVLIKEHNSLPEFEPIAWRETTKTTLGSFRYLIRILLTIEVPVLTICLFAVAFSGSSYYQSHRSGAVTTVNIICWVLAILLTVVRAATLVSGERSHETLDVLLTTPISGRELILQKYRGVQRLIWVVSIPLITGTLMQAWYCNFTSRSNIDIFVENQDRSPLIYLIVQVPCIFIMIRLFAWISLLLGMWMKTSTRAIFAALAFIVGWMVLPVVILITFFEVFHVGRGDIVTFSLTASPVMVPFLVEIGEMDDLFDDSFYWLVVTLHLLGYSALLYIIRRYCLARAANYLGRSEDQWR